MSATIATTVSPDAAREMLRYADVLAAVAEQLQLASFANRLRELLALAKSGSPVEHLAKIVQSGSTCVHGVAEHLEKWLSVARARVEQRNAEFQRLSGELDRVQGQLRKPGANRAALSQQEQDFHKQLTQLTALAEKELRYLALLEDCRAEVEWCRGGMSCAWQTLQSGKPCATPAFPTRPFRHRAAYEQWVASLQPTFRATSQLFPDHGQRLQTVLERLQARTATVTFGGRFKSGKSSLLNAALGRPLLPTKDLPETGANCYITSGSHDEAQLVCGAERRRIECRTEALREAISLRGGSQGTQRMAGVNRLEIQLVNFPGGPHVQWIDPPGMFDRPEMTERAWDAAHRADVMVWVFRSQQFLGEAEAEAIAEFMVQRGSAAIVFVENAFLPADVPDPWAYHLTEIAPVDRGKLEHLAGDLGLSREQIPPLVVTSAAGVLKHGHGYGAGELRRLLGRLASPDCPMIRRARLQWAERELAMVIADVRAQWQQLSDENNKRKAALEKYHETTQKVRDRFEAAVREAVAALVTRFEADAAAAGEQVAAKIAGDLLRDNTYENLLHEVLSERAQELVELLIRHVNHEAGSRQQSPLTSAAQAHLRRLLTPPRSAVVVANNSVSGGTVAAGAGAGAAAGAWFFGIGAVPGAIIGGTIAALGSGKAAFDKDCLDTKTNINAAAAKSASELRDHERRAIACILGGCYALGEAAPPPLDSHREEALFNLYQQLDAAARTAAEWIRREAVA